MSARILGLLLGVSMLAAADGKLTDEQRIELLRGLHAEYATVKAPLPRSKKPLAFPAKGQYDKSAWQEAEREMGPAAKIKWMESGAPAPARYDNQIVWIENVKKTTKP